MKKDLTEKQKKARLQWLLGKLAEERDARFVPQMYADISEFLQDFDLLPGKHSYWRLTEVLVGQINALPLSRGFLVATDGILCYIIKQDGTLYKGHVQHFVKDTLEDVGLDFKRAKPPGEHTTQPRRKREYRLEIYD